MADATFHQEREQNSIQIPSVNQESRGGCERRQDTIIQLSCADIFSDLGEIEEEPAHYLRHTVDGRDSSCAGWNWSEVRNKLNELHDMLEVLSLERQSYKEPNLTRICTIKVLTNAHDLNILFFQPS